MKIEITKHSIELLLKNKSVKIAIKTFLVLIMSLLSVVFFGLFLPFFLLAMKILPSLGLAGVIYVYLGGIFGLLFGGISSAYSLGKSKSIVTRYYVVMIVSLLLLSFAYLICYIVMYERFSHI